MTIFHFNSSIPPPLARTSCSWANENSWRNHFPNRFSPNLNLEIINPQTFVRRNPKGLLEAIEGKGRDTLETVLYENTWKLAILSHKKLEENVVRFFARASIHFPLWKANHSFFPSFFFLFSSFLASYVTRKNERDRVSRLPKIQ